MADNRPVRVLAVVHQMGRGGMESRLMDILRCLDYRTVAIDIFSCCMEPGIFDEEVRVLGGKIYYNPVLTVRNMFWYITYFKRFLEHHREYKIIHAHQNAWCSVFCKGAYLADVPVRIAHSRTAISSLSLKGVVKNLIKLPTCRYATHYFAVSDLAGKWLFGSKNMKNGKVKVWKNAIDCEKYRFDPEKREAVRTSLGIKDEKIFLNVGNFRKGKNQIFLIAILEEIRKTENGILIFVGAPVENGCYERIKHEVLERGLERYVMFLGSRDDVPDLMMAADVLCCPSFFEGMPGAVLEAQAAGLPCVISSSITQEVMILETTKALSLKQPLEEWSRVLLKSLRTDRKDTFREMEIAGFDIHSLVYDMTKFYIKVGDGYGIRKNCE